MHLLSDIQKLNNEVCRVCGKVSVNGRWFKFVEKFKDGYDLTRIAICSSYKCKAGIEAYVKTIKVLDRL